MNEKQSFWLAGLLEGEACFDVSKSTRENKNGSVSVYRYPRVQLHMNDRDVVQRVADFVGEGNVNGPYGLNRSDGINSKGFYKWQLNGESALKLMRSILPLMGERRTQKINEILALCS